jgi:uncharacterized membrane protein
MRTNDDSVESLCQYSMLYILLATIPDISTVIVDVSPIFKVFLLLVRIALFKLDGVVRVPVGVICA